MIGRKRQAIVALQELLWAVDSLTSRMARKGTLMDVEVSSAYHRLVRAREASGWSALQALEPRGMSDEPKSPPLP